MNSVVKSAIAKTTSSTFDPTAKEAEYARYPDEHLKTLIAEMPDQIAEAFAAVEEAKRNLEYTTAKQKFLQKVLASRASEGFQIPPAATFTVQ